MTSKAVLPVARALVFAVGVSLVLLACNQPAPNGSATSSTPSADPLPESVDVDLGPSDLTELDAVASSAATSLSDICSIDTIDGSLITPGVAIPIGNPAAVTVSGWLIDRPSMARPPATVRLARIEGGQAWEIGAGPSVHRDDVAAHLDNALAAHAGIATTIDLSALPVGEYALTFAHRQGDATVVCDRDVRILLEG